MCGARVIANLSPQTPVDAHLSDLTFTVAFNRRMLNAPKYALTLLCHERIPPREHCHRTVLVELLTEELPRS